MASRKFIFKTTQQKKKNDDDVGMDAPKHLQAAQAGLAEIQKILDDPAYADPSTVAGQAAARVRLMTSKAQDLLQSVQQSEHIRGCFQNLDPRKALTSAAGLSAAAASGWTILNTPLAILASETVGIGLGYTALLAGGVATVGGAVGGGIGYGIHKGVEAIQGKSIGENWYDTNALGARTFAKWTTEAELFGHCPLDVSGWF